MISVRHGAGLSLLLSMVACGSAFEGGGADTSAAGSTSGGSTATGSGGGSTGSGGGSTGTGSGGGSTGTGSGGAGGAGGTTTSAVEDCTNGVDDDQNGLADCADGACGDVSCTPPLPPGWEGPVWLAQNAGANFACPPGSKTMSELHVGPPVVDDAVCSCTCSPSGGTCASTVDVLAYEDGACSTGSVIWGGLGDGACHAVSVGGTLGLFLEPRLVDVQPTCEGHVVADPPAIVPLGEAVVCLPDAVGAGCAGGGACQRSPGGLATCVYQMGETDCPGGAFATRTLLYGDVNDDRGCDCACGAAVNADCDAHFELMKEDTCVGDPGVLGLENSCVNLGNVAAKSVRVVASPGAPSAMCGLPLSYGPIGGASLVGAMTVCCAP